MTPTFREVESRWVGAKLKRDEIPVNVAERMTALYEDEDGASSGDSDEPDSSKEGPKVSRENHKQASLHA
jgi:hypothetical protein